MSAHLVNMIIGRGAKMVELERELTAAKKRITELEADLAFLQVQLSSINNRMGYGPRDYFGGIPLLWRGWEP